MRRIIRISFFISLGLSGFYLWSLALLARGEKPLTDWASDLTVRSSMTGFDRCLGILTGNLPVLSLFCALLCALILVRGRDLPTQWKAVALVCLAGLGILVSFGARFIAPLATTAAANGFDPVFLLVHLPHGLIEFAAFMFPLCFAVAWLTVKQQLPAAHHALIAVLISAGLLLVAGAVEGWITPQLLPAAH
jgi:hypothetical protein